jgi:hypothetical protein
MLGDIELSMTEIVEKFKVYSHIGKGTVVGYRN